VVGTQHGNPLSDSESVAGGDIGHDVGCKWSRSGLVVPLWTPSTSSPCLFLLGSMPWSILRSSLWWYVIAHRVLSLSSIPSKGVSKLHVERSEFTSYWRALALAQILGPLCELGGLDVVFTIRGVASHRLHRPLQPQR
jgi:hypothetical protein